MSKPENTKKSEVTRKRSVVFTICIFDSCNFRCAGVKQKQFNFGDDIMNVMEYLDDLSLTVTKRKK